MVVNIVEPIVKYKAIAERSIYTQQLVNKFKALQEGESVKYQELSDIIGMDASPGGNGYQYVQSAIHIVLTEHNIVIQNIRKYGYQHSAIEDVAKSEPDCIVSEMKRRLKKSKRINMAVRSKWDEISPEARTRNIFAGILIESHNHQLKAKGLKRLEDVVRKHGEIGFKQTLELFQ